MATTATDLKLIQRDTVDVVAERVRQFQESGELSFPANYSPENAMKAAWLTIQETVDRNSKPALEVCTKNSIANALLGMVVQGLNPAKKQCYFIVYGSQLQLQRSYFGTMHIAKTVDPNIDDIIADVVYEGDTFTYAKQRGRTVITNHEQKLENVDKSKIIAAYCSVYYKDGTERTTIMTMDDIKQAWRQSKMNPLDEKGNLKISSTHGKFTSEMAKKTVINNACKSIINSSDDSNLIIKAYRQSSADVAESEAQAEVNDHANKLYVNVDTSTGEVIEDVSEPVENIPEEMPIMDAVEDELP